LKSDKPIRDDVIGVHLMSLDELLKKKLHELDESILAVSISPKQIDFEEKISLLCFNCKNYNSKFTCPPRIPN